GRARVFDRVTAAIGEAARGRRLVIVPGGGPFADAVRQMFNRFGIGEEAAHWMAILGMDQYAHALVARISGAALVEGETEIAATLAAGRIPVLAPFRWLRTADPLPHSWDVTSDSIAAWLTGALGARRLVLIKPVSRQPASQLVDAHFVRALPAGVEHLSLTARDVPLVRALGADLVGVRGAACVGGRLGRVTRARVAALSALARGSAPLRAALARSAPSA